MQYIPAACQSWTNGAHSRCAVLARVGSNPTVAIYFFFALKK